MNRGTHDVADEAPSLLLCLVSALRAWWPGCLLTDIDVGTQMDDIFSNQIKPMLDKVDQLKSSVSDLSLALCMLC